MLEFSGSEKAPAALSISPSSFKKKIIKRIVASTRYYLSILDIEKAEAGLITVLRIVGYLSSDIIGVSISIFRSLFTLLDFLFIFTG